MTPCYLFAKQKRTLARLETLLCRWWGRRQEAENQPGAVRPLLRRPEPHPFPHRLPVLALLYLDLCATAV